MPDIFAREQYEGWTAIYQSRLKALSAEITGVRELIERQHELRALRCAMKAKTSASSHTAILGASS